MSIIHCKLPKAGLGNQLFPLLSAYLFGQLNDFPVITSGYHSIKIGPYLRMEKSKRQYSNYFIFQKGLIGSWLDAYKLKSLSRWTVVKEPILKKVIEASGPCLYEFGTIPHWSDYFSQLKDNREAVIDIFHSLLRKNIAERAAVLPAPCIGVHIRMGDFRKLKAGEEFSKVGAVRTPENYFIEMISAIRQMHGSNLPVSVFTDGYPHELEKLLALENVKIIEGNSDIVDMLLLSRSKIIVTSAGSTFSYWAAFLADAPVIMHPDHLHQPLRPASVNGRYYEGPLVFGNPKSLLAENIRAIN